MIDEMVAVLKEQKDDDSKEEYCEKCSRIFVDSSILQWAAAVAGKYSPRRKHVREHAVIRRSVVRMRGGGRRQCAGTNTG